MDPHVRWLRRRIARSVARTLILAGPVAFVVALVALRIATGAGLVTVVPWAGLGAQMLIICHLVWAAATNPLDVRYLRGRISRRRQLSIANSTSDAPASIEPLSSHELTTLATVWDTTEAPQPLFDLFQTPRRSVVVVRHRASDALSLLSRLDDGRILVTDTVAPPPHRRLVVNRAPHGALGDLLACHLETIARLRLDGLTVEAGDAGLFVELHAIEQVALESLGPVLGAFYNPTPRVSRTRVLVTLAADELLGLALDPSRTPLRPRTSTPTPAPA